MTRSYRQIDYRVRPAKHAERLMMCEAFRRLRFGTVETYQYIGMGSLYFSDFALFHRALGIERMFSIEIAEHDRKRFEQNLPFSNIGMLWGSTASQLPNVDFSDRTIAWLDYDGVLDNDVLDDLRAVVTRISSGSFYCVSVQCSPEESDAEAGVSALQSLAGRVGGSRIDPKWTEEDFAGWGTAQIIAGILRADMAQVLSERNGERSPSRRLVAEQVLYFQYKDGARMLTLGWVFFEAGQRGLFDLSSFGDLTFYRPSTDAFVIDIPKLTSGELRRLSALMPCSDERIVVESIPPSDIAKFQRIYRYFTNLTFVDL